MGSTETKLLEGIVKAVKEGGDPTNPSTTNMVLEKKIKKLWTHMTHHHHNKQKNQPTPLTPSLFLEQEDAISFFGGIYDFLISKYSELSDSLDRSSAIVSWFSFYDKDGDGKISFCEFHDIVTLICNPFLMDKKIKQMEATRNCVSSLNTSCNGCIKLVLCGPSDVGKTSLMNRFVDGSFNENYIPFAMDAEKAKILQLESQRVLIRISDTCGEERFRLLTNSYFKGCSGAIVVFDLTSPNSFENVENWISIISVYSGQGTPKILIGNKSDLVDERKITTQQIQEFIIKHENLKYFETSAKNNTNVEEAFLNLSSTCARALIPKNISEVTLQSIPKSPSSKRISGNSSGLKLPNWVGGNSSEISSGKSPRSSTKSPRRPEIATPILGGGGDPMKSPRTGFLSKFHSNRSVEASPTFIKREVGEFETDTTGGLSTSKSGLLSPPLPKFYDVSPSESSRNSRQSSPRDTTSAEIPSSENFSRCRVNKRRTTTNLDDPNNIVSTVTTTNSAVVLPVLGAAAVDDDNVVHSRPKPHRRCSAGHKSSKTGPLLDMNISGKLRNSGVVPLSVSEPSHKSPRKNSGEYRQKSPTSNSLRNSSLKPPKWPRATVSSSTSALQISTKEPLTKKDTNVDERKNHRE